MTKLPTADELNQLPREELVAVILLLIEEVQTLRAEVARLKGPPPTSRNSSQPPSRDWKANRSAKRAKPHGAKPGHAPMVRPLVDTPDRLIEVKPDTCGQCGHDLRHAVAQRIIRRQVTELPEIKPVVLETRQHEVVCPACHVSMKQPRRPCTVAAGRIWEHTGPAVREREHLLRVQDAWVRRYAVWEAWCQPVVVFDGPFGSAHLRRPAGRARIRV